MVGWHHCFSGHEFEQAPGDGEGQGSLAFCSPWVAKNLTQLTDLTTTTNTIFKIMFFKNLNSMELSVILQLLSFQ